MVFFTKVAGLLVYIPLFRKLTDFWLPKTIARSIQGHVARAARGAVRSGPLRQTDVLHRLQVGPPGETFRPNVWHVVSKRAPSGNMDVSEDSGFSPQIINFNRVFHYKPSILGYPYFRKHPYVYQLIDINDINVSETDRKSWRTFL